MQNKIVARYQDGRVEKGFTRDFMPNRDTFHLIPFYAPSDDKAIAITIAELKAIFFVKDFTGNPKYEDVKDFDPDKSVVGRKIRVVFKDGEVIVGTTQGYQPNRPGFFIFPVDPQSNNERCYVIAAATEEVTLL